MRKTLLITVLLVVIGCKNSTEDLAFDTITIHHQSALVDEQYQRSYTIQATPDKIHVVIDGAKSTILDTTFDNKYDQFLEYVKAYEYLDMGKTEMDPNCGGCYIRDINLSKNAVEVYQAKWNNAENHPALQRLVDVVINSIPGFGELLARSE